MKQLGTVEREPGWPCAYVLTSIYPPGSIGPHEIEVWTPVPEGEDLMGLGRRYHAAVLFVTPLRPIERMYTATETEKV